MSIQVMKQMANYIDVLGGDSKKYRQAIAEAEQEPVAWRTFDGEGGYDYRNFEDNESYKDEYTKRNGDKYKNWVEPLYTYPHPKREWVGLTDEDKASLIYNCKTYLDFEMLAAIEAKLKEKNA